MLSYSLSREKGRPLYDQLYRLLRADIESGALSEGERLPGRRALSQQLGVSRVTVETAYQQLAAEGYVHARAGSGYYVDKIDAPPPRTAAPAGFAPIEADAGYPVDFVKNAADEALFPFSVWARLTRAALIDHERALLAAVPPMGIPELRAAIARLLYRMKGISCAPEQIVIGAGIEYLFNMLIQFLGRDRVTAVETPGYPLTARILRKNGMRLAPVEMDEHGVRMDALAQSGARALVLSPSHHFPTGIVTSIGRRRELLRWAEETDSLIVENDYDSEFRYSGMPIPSLMSADAAGRVIYINTFSKSIAPSVRVGYMVLPPALAARYREEMSFYTCAAPALEQYVVERFLTLGYYDRHISRMKRSCRARRDRVIALLRKSALAERVTILEADAGLHFLLRVRTNESDAALKWALRRVGVRVACLSDYTYPGTTAEAHVLVINYSNVDMDALEGLFPRIEQTLTREV